jgi:hypothetical protein
MVDRVVGDPRARSRFERDGLVLQALSTHPGIVTVRQTGVRSFRKRGYVLTDRMSDASLAEYVAADGRLSFAVVLDVGVKLAGALETAHRAGVVHGHLSPNSMFLSSAGEAQLAGLDLAVLEPGRLSALNGLAERSAYVAPELRAGADPSVAADVYALAASMVTLLAGTPVEASNEKAWSHLDTYGVPEAVGALLRQCLAAEPATRPVSAAALGTAIQGLQRELRLPIAELFVDDAAAHQAATARWADAVAEPAPSVEAAPALEAVASEVRPTGVAGAGEPAAATSAEAASPPGMVSSLDRAPRSLLSRARPGEHPEKGDRMNRTTVTAALLIIPVVVAIGAVAWIAVTGTLQQLASGSTTAESANDDAARDTASAAQDRSTPEPAPAQQPAAATPSPAVSGLHVLCPVSGGGYVHLLLTATTYYKAVTPEEEARLTELFGPPVTNVDPSRLPPKSPMSVTDVLAGNGAAATPEPTVPRLQ